MEFTANGHARKGSFRFELRFGQYLDGKPQDKPYFLYIEDVRNSKAQGTRLFAHTERSFRFADRESAAVFCEEVAAGKISLDAIKEVESACWQKFRERVIEEGEKEFESFLRYSLSLGVDPKHIPSLFRRFTDLSDHAHSLVFDRDKVAQMTEQIKGEAEAIQTPSSDTPKTNPVALDSIDNKIFQAKMAAERATHDVPVKENSYDR